MVTVELAARPDLKTTGFDPKPAPQTPVRPEAFAAPQALSLSPQRDPFEAKSDAQPSDRGYDDYWLDPVLP